MFLFGILKKVWPVIAVSLLTSCGAHLGSLGAGFTSLNSSLSLVSADPSPVAGACISISVRNLDNSGTQVAAYSDVPVSLSGTGSGSFYSDTLCTSAVRSTTITSGTSNTTAFFRDTVVESLTLVASAPTLTDGNLSLSISPAPPSQLAFRGGPSPISADQCVGYALETQDQYNNPSPVSASTAIGLTGAGAGSFFGDSGCAQPATSVSFPPGASSLTVYFKDTQVEAISLNASASGILPANLAVSCTAANGAELAFTRAPASFAAGACAAFTLELRDPFHNPTSPTNPLTINLSAGSSVGKFYSDSACSSSVSSISLPANSSNIAFYFADKLAQSISVAAAAAGITSATQNASVIGGSPAQLVLTGPATVPASSCSSSYSVRVEDALGNLATVSKLTLNLTAQTASGKASAGFYPGGDCSSPTTALPIPANGIGVFYVEDGTAESFQIAIRDSNNTLPTANLSVTVQPQPPGNLVFMGSNSLSAGTCQAYELQSQNSAKMPSGVASATTISLAASGNGGFFSDAGCTVSITTVSLNQGDSQTKAFYFTDKRSESVNFSASASGLSSLAYAVTVSALPPSQLRFVSPVVSILAGACAGYTVSSNDPYGNLSNPSGITVNLAAVNSANAQSGAIYSDSQCKTQVTSASLAKGSTTAQFYVQDKKAEGITLTAQATSLTSASQALTITPAPISALSLTGPTSITSGTCNAYTATLQDAFGNNASGDTYPLSFAGGGNGVFYTDNACASTGSKVSVAKGASSAKIFFKDAFPESLSLAVSSPPLTPGALTVKSLGGATITAVSPPSGPTAGGTLVTFVGNGFVSGTTVSLGAQACLSVSVVSSTQLTCTTPPHSAGAVDAVLTVPSGQSTRVSGAFTYQDPLTFVSLAVTPATPTIPLGSTLAMTATGKYNDGTTKSVTTKVTWSSSNPNAITITAAGVATAAGPGQSTLTAKLETATQGSVSGSTLATVGAATLAAIAVNPGTQSVPLGRSQKFLATGIFSNGAPGNIPGSVTWTSSDAKIAKIDASGLATTVAQGTAIITAQYGALTAKAVLKVVAPVLSAINVSPLNPSVALGKTVSFSAAGVDSAGSNVTLSSVKWASSNTSIATIDSSGLATTVGQGVTTLSATFGNISGTVTLTVLPPALVSLSISPSNPWISPGESQLFTATGTYTNATTAPLVGVTWASSNTSRVTINSSGLATAILPGPSTITATSNGISATTTLTVGTITGTAGAIASGGSFSCAVVNSAVLCWGANGVGQLGESSSAPYGKVPTPVQGLTSGVTAVSAYHAHACAIVNGGAWCWGDNSNGQLGNGSTIDSRVPVAVHGLTQGVQAISAGYSHTCALVNGGLQCWGANTFGQLGNGPTTDSSVPVPVKGLTQGVAGVAAGGEHSCAVVNGGMKCWGRNVSGQLGDNTQTDSSVPVQVKGLTSGVQQITLGFSSSCALVNGGAQCWGENDDGEVGDGSTTDRLIPTAVQGLTRGVRAITAGEQYACAILNGGAKCWGYNYYGQLGDNTTTNRPLPTLVQGLTDGVQAITAGMDHTCALVNGGLQCWGGDDYAQLGNQSLAFSDPVPVPVLGLRKGLGSVAAGVDHTCALVNGATQCWGANASGQLGNNSTTDSNVPVAVQSLSAGGEAVAPGGSHTCALVNGGVQCWGHNNNGQLGNQSTTNSSIPVPVSGLSSSVQAIASGSNHSCALTNGAVQCWGLNSHGQLGNQSTTDSNIPVAVKTLTSGVSAISANYFHNCALANGGVWCWGLNNHGQLGTGSTTDSAVPVPVVGLTSGVQAIATGQYHSCALVNGGVLCWGLDNHGQLGDGTVTESHVPVPVQGLSAGAQSLVAGIDHTCAIVNGGAQCWGYNIDGQLGNGATSDNHVPFAMSTLTAKVQALAAGGDHSCGIIDGIVQCWGQNLNGELGNHATANSSVPVLVFPWE